MKQTNFLKSLFLLFALIVGSVSVWGESYTITFANSANNVSQMSSSTYATTVIKNDGSRGYVTSQPFTINSGNCYYGDTQTCIRIGKSGESSSLSIALSPTGSVKATSIVVNCNNTGGKNNTGAKLNVNGIGQQTTTDTAENYTFTFTNATDITNITLEGTAIVRIYSITVNYVAAPTYIITAQSNNNSYGTVSLSGSVITGSPNSGYRYADPAYTVTAGTATVSQEGNAFTVTPSTDCTVQINFEAIPTHDVTWNVNGVTTVVPYEEDAVIDFSGSPASIGGKVFMGWSAAPIDGTTDVEPSYVTEATMNTSDLTYYAVFANEIADEEDASLTINKDTENFPDSYGTANKFTEYSLEEKKFKIQQGYVNGEKLQWRASGNSNGTGTMYNTDALNKIQSIVLTYDASDSNKNFTINVGNAENPTSGTAITPSISDNVYTFGCSGENYDYFVMTNGEYAGYLTSITINYKKETIEYNAYCTSVTVPVTIGAYGYASFASTSALDFTGSGITAYIATANEAENVTMTEIAKVPANTGVVLKGTEGTVNVPVLNGDADDTTGNLLKPGEKTVDGDEATAGTIYAFGRKGGQVGFVKAHEGFIIAADKAYLDLNGKLAKGADFLSFVFGDEGEETDGINAVSTTVENGVRYNLAGQKVGADYKGIVIVNGKKVIIK